MGTYPGHFYAADITWATVVSAKQMMRDGLDLHQTAAVLGILARDLDIALWRTVGERP